MSTCWVYLLKCADNSLYTGWTNDLERRLASHNSGAGSKYTRARLPVTLFYREACADKSAAMRREYEIKQLTRAQKIALAATERILPMQEIPSIAYTHGGRFHADDVFSSALLRILNPEIEIRRTFSLPAGYDGLAFDLGWGAFDHHQKEAPIRENGVPYAAFGLLWRQFGEGLLGADEAARFDTDFVQPLDLDDNTGCGGEIPALIAAFNPLWDSKRAADDCFAEAVLFARTILEKKFESVRGIQRARELVETALAAAVDGIVVLPRYAPWKMTLLGTDAVFVVYPSQRGGFSAQAVPNDDPARTLKKPFPAAWAGVPEDQLPQISGIVSLRFCHNNRFLIAADTHEDAILACKIAAKT